mgnify:CR=1 FL=1
MKKYSKILLFIFISFFSVNLCAQTLTMGYRTSERLPLIAQTPDNSGLYYDLYSTAAKKLNMQLKIIRLPKKRILEKMKEGIIDFYPGFTFTQERTKFIYFLENGISTGKDIGLSLMTFPLIKELNQLKGKRVISALGGPISGLLSNVKGIKLNKVSRLSIKKAIDLLYYKRYEFYIYNEYSVKYYLKKNNINYIKLHPDCCGENKPMYLGFSRTSKYFKETINPKFDEKEAISINNIPTEISKKSIAYRFAKILNDMKENGEIDLILNKYNK